jgi:trehalose 6-phosphate synthase
VLSRYAGAAQQLRDALVIDPFDLNESADALARALTMSSDQQRSRMQKLRANVAEFDGQWWMRQLMADAMSVHHRTTSAANADAVGRSLSA